VTHAGLLSCSYYASTHFRLLYYWTRRSSKRLPFRVLSLMEENPELSASLDWILQDAHHWQESKQYLQLLLD
jgi:hypothetical protein